MLPFDFSELDEETTMRMSRNLIYNEVHRFMEERGEGEETISIIRRLSSSSKVYQNLVTKTQLKKDKEDKDKKCVIM